MITVGSATNSGLVTVTVECGDSQLAVKLANEVFDSLNEFLADTSIQVYYKCAVVESSPATEAVYVSPAEIGVGDAPNAEIISMSAREFITLIFIPRKSSGE